MEMRPSTWEPTPRAEFLALPAECRQPEEEVVQTNINYLISALYKPDEARGAIIDGRRVKQLLKEKGAREAVNFGDLQCTYVEKRGDVYVAHVEEASPGAVVFREYLESYMARWGWWNVVVEQEW